MDNAGYATITRQTGLRHELQTLANNIANSSTTGYQREGLVFSEYVQQLENADSSLSMGRAEGRLIDTTTGAHRQTGGTFDLAIHGPGYFLIETPDGVQLTRAGNFSPNANGDMVTSDGFRLLDAGRTPVFIPQGVTDIKISPDGTMSADGDPLTQIGVFQPADPNNTERASGTRLRTDGEIDAVQGTEIIQGFLEDSNVDAISEITRLIEVQRAYEQGGEFLKNEDQRMRSVIDTLGS